MFKAIADFIEDIVPKIWPDEIIKFLFTSGLTVFLMRIKGFREKRKHKRKISLLKKATTVTDDILNIYTVENAVPEYGNILLVTSGKTLLVRLPEEYKGKTPEDLHFSDKNISFNGTDSFDDLAEQTGIKDLAQRIERHSRTVANDFIYEMNGCKSNETKYGVLDISIGRRVGRHDLPVAIITIFTTDFFTFRVFSAISAELKDQKHEMFKIKSLHHLLQYNCFLCSIGINAIVEIDSTLHRKTEVILAERSSHPINADKYGGMLHISVNESVCVKDRLSTSENVSLEKCLLRGMDEELGIREDSHLKDGKTKYAFWDMFVNKDTFDFGITSHVYIKDLYFDEVTSRPAKDAKFERGPLQQALADEIERFIEGKRVIPQGLYTINSFLIRKYGRALKVPLEDMP